MTAAVNVLLRLLACTAASYAAWRFWGPSGLVFSAPLFGLALARPIMEGLISGYAGLRGSVYRDVSGRHFAYRGRSLDVRMDEAGFQWLRLSDVRRLLPNLPRDDSLAQALGPACVTLQPTPPRIQAEALHAYLAKASAPDSVKFRTWIERTIMLPAAKARALQK